MTTDYPNLASSTRVATLICGHIGDPLDAPSLEGLGICLEGCGIHRIRSHVDTSRRIPAWEPRTGSYTQDTNGNICVRETEKCAPVISAKGAVWAEWRCGCRVYGNITKTKMKRCGGTPAPKPARKQYGGTPAPKPARNYYFAGSLAAVSAVLFGAAIGAVIVGVFGSSGNPEWLVRSLSAAYVFTVAGMFAARAYRETNTGRPTR